MELIIDSQRCDLGPEKLAVPGYDAMRTADIDACREGRSLKIVLSPTPRNDAAAGFARDPYSAARFNAARHKADVMYEGAVLLAGTIRLLGASDEGYTLEIREGGAEWAQQAAQRMFNTLGVDYRATLTPTTVTQSWTNGDPVKFFPILRDEYPQQNSSTDLLPAERVLSVDDYHPFLHIATLVKTIFEEAGYRIRSRFMESSFFQKLYMSGAYASRDTAAAAARMGFFARRLAAATATANDIGRVAADPKALSHTLGNIVDTATPQSVDADGKPIPELYNNGGCFSVVDQRIVFTPPTEVSAGFEYYLKYTTDHRILTRTRLRGFDSVYLGPGTEMPFVLANRYPDRRGQIATNFTYRAIVFSHAAGAQYRLIYTRNGTAGTVWTEFAARTAQVTTPASGSVANPVLQIRTGAFWSDYTGDWALYDGYIAETGRTTVELRVRTAAEIVTPASPKRFDLIYFSGAEQGMSITLHKECSLRPRFLSGPGYGSVVEFADVARHRIRQSVLLEAIAHLFNLRFCTEPATRTVRIEPSDEVSDTGRVADWTSKTDFSQPVVLQDIAPEVHERRTWGYTAGDGAVTRFDAEAEAPLGEWSFSVDSYAAKQGEQVLRNPLFGPTLNASGHYLSAPDARIMQVGDRDRMDGDGTNFTPRIVLYEGMHPLPVGQRWGYPWGQESYPLAAFHFPGDGFSDGFSLCFEDRDEQQGLHRHYDRQTAQESTLQRITLSLRIAPHEFAALFAPGCGDADTGSVFLIDTGQGVVRTSLHRIDNYDPTAASVRGTFTRLPED